MDLLFNPIILSVLVLCVLCLVKVNVLVALILAAITAGLSGGIDIGKTMTLLADGFSANATTALSYRRSSVSFWPPLPACRKTWCRCILPSFRS